MKRSRIPAGKLLFVPVLLLLSAIGVHAQKGRGRQLPHIGFLQENQQAGGGKEGCGNHVLYRNENSQRAIFLSDDEGFNAWMNFDGRNVELRLVKTTLYHRDALDADAIYEYRYKDVRVTVRLRQLADYVFYFPARIVVRRGNSSRIVRAVVSPQCD